MMCPVAKSGYNIYNIKKISTAMTERIRCRTPFRELEMGVNLSGNYIERSS